MFFIDDPIAREWYDGMIDTCYDDIKLNPKGLQV